MRVAGKRLVGKREAAALARTLSRVGGRMLPRTRLELSVALVDEVEMKDLNSRYRGLDVSTDVLSFPQLNREEMGRASRGTLGDVVICVPVAEGQARERGETVLEELEVLAVHGLLHLLGYDDEDREGAEEMARMETRLLGRTIITE